MTVNAGVNANANQKAEREHRRELVSAMLCSRFTYRQMIEALDRQGVTVSLGTLSNDAQVIRDEWKRRYAENYESHVAEQTAQLDLLLQAWLPKARTSGEDAAAAARVAVSLMDRKARLLGLDRPARIEHTGKDGGPIEVADDLVTRGEEAIDEVAQKREQRQAV